MSKLPKPLPCPFCGSKPEVGPTGDSCGDAFGWVACVNMDCPAEEVMVRDGDPTADDRGREAYQAIAIRRWNRRWRKEPRWRKELAAAQAEVERLRVQTQRVVDEWDAWLSEAPPEWVSPGMLEAVDALRGEGEE